MIKAMACQDGCDGRYTFIRASGDVLCTGCGKPYWRHPLCMQSGYNLNGVTEYALHVICDGTHVKL